MDSLFFHVSLDASRSRIALSLLLTMGPLVLAAPLVGPLVRRAPAGFRTILFGTFATRAVLAWLLAANLDNLAFYLLVFAYLVVGKAYSVARTAAVPRLVDDHGALVATNAYISRIATIVAMATAVVAAASLLVVDGSVLLVVAGGAQVAAATIAATLAPIPRRVDPAPDQSPTPAGPGVWRAAGTLAVLRGATGFVSFLLAFALKKSGGDQWVFALALGAASLGSFSGTLIAPHWRRKLSEERLLAFACVSAGVGVLFSAISFSNATIVAAALALGLGTNVGERAVEGIVGRVRSDDSRTTTFGRAEVLYQLTWVAGSLVALGVVVSPRVGFAVAGGVLLATALVYARMSRISLRRTTRRVLLAERHGSPDVPVPELLAWSARRHLRRGEYRIAVALADAAVRATRRRGELAPDDAANWSGHAVLVDELISHDTAIRSTDARRIVATALRIATGASTPAEDAVESDPADALRPR